MCETTSIGRGKIFLFSSFIISRLITYWENFGYHYQLWGRSFVLASDFGIGVALGSVGFHLYDNS